MPVVYQHGVRSNVTDTGRSEVLVLFLLSCRISICSDQLFCVAVNAVCLFITVGIVSRYCTQKNNNFLLKLKSN